MPLPLRVAPFRSTLLALVAVSLAACGNLGDRSEPIPTEVFSGVGEADVPTLVIVLPGRGDNVEVMQKYQVAQAIHAGWPEVDVQLTSATLAYYLDGGLAAKARDQLLLPARAKGYQRIIVMGASMGGMGSLIVDEANPGLVDHLVLMAPYLGKKKLLREIESAGGIANWQPGPKPAAMDSDNFQHELWRHIQTFVDDAERRQRVWLAYGKADRLAKTVPIIAPALQSNQVLPREGGHKWVVWNAAATDVFSRLRAASMAAATQTSGQRG